MTINWKRHVSRALAPLSLAPAREAEIAEELSQHLQDRFDELRSSGASAGEARRAALQELDDRDLVRELSGVEPPAAARIELGEGERRAPVVAASDVRYAFRALRKSPLFATVVVATLALGIGANAAIFSAVNGVVLRPLPYANADRLVVVYGNLVARNMTNIVVSAMEYVDFRARNRVFDEMAAYDTAAFTLTGGAEPERLNGAIVTSTLLPLLGVAPALGRPFEAADQEAGRPQVALLGHALWRRRFAADAGIVGRPITVDGKPVEVVGVMPAGFAFPDEDVEVWVPLVLDADLLSENNRGSRSYTVLGRLSRGISVAQAQAGMNAVADAMAREHGESYRGGFSTTVRDLRTDIVGDVTRVLFVLMAAVGVVLLIACANIANLMLVRGHARRRDVAIRAALGANRRRIVAQLLAESAVLALAGGAVGLLAGAWGLDLLVAIAPSDIPRLSEISLDRRVVFFTAAVSMITGVVFGLLPAVQSARVDVHDTLREGGRTASGRHHRTARLLVVAEVAMSLVLLIAGGLLLASFARIQRVPPGFDAHGVVTFRIAPAEAKYTFQQSEQLFADIFGRLLARPGIEAVAATNALPFTEFGGDRSFFIEGRLQPRPEDQPDEQVRFISAGYFEAMRVPVRHGREFTVRDTLAAPRVAVVNEALARKYWPNEEAIGKRITFSRNEPAWYQVVGVVGDIRHRSLDAVEHPELYVPYSQPLFANPSPRPMFVVVRTAGDVMGAAVAAREVVAAVDRDQPISNVRTMEQRIDASLASRRFTMLLIGLFGMLALALAVVGIYGVVAYAVGSRTHEIGVRLALGAPPRAVLAMLVGDGMKLALAGAAVGIGAAFAVTRVMEGLLFGVSATDASTFAVITAGLTLVALAACYLPARRASAVNPVTALRAD
jgi:putative ABC transport system permease protein